MTPSPDLSILRFLAARTHATAAEIGIFCRMTVAEVRSQLVMLDLMGFVSGRQNDAAVPPGRIYAVTIEGRRKVRLSDARRQDA